jgi:pimeloyl-ACP methyl ester carboxylesterase
LLQPSDVEQDRADHDLSPVVNGRSRRIEMAVSTMTNASTSTTQPDIRPFRVDVPEADIEDLRRRLTTTRWPDKELVADPSQGVQSATIQELARYWATEHDWRKTEAKLNALPQFTTKIDGLDIHFIHVKSRHENALPLIITHGWPGSVIEMLDVIGPLTDPTAHGGSAQDAFDVVIPSLPGYGFSEKPTQLGWGAGRIATAWAELMNRLGYTRYVAQGGDQGATVTETMARIAPAGLAGIHLNLLASFPTEVGAAVFGDQFAMGLVKRVGVAVIASRAEKEATALAAVEGLFTRGYLAEMNQRPQTIGFSQADTPVGLAAWMLDHDGDSYEKISHAFLDGRPAGNLTRDRIVDNMSLYWLTNTATSAARLYWENYQVILASFTSTEKPPKLTLPVAFTVFPQEIFQAPRSWAEKVYPNLIYFNEAERGGHFAAWEEPELFAEELRKAFQSLRSPS